MYVVFRIVDNKISNEYLLQMLKSPEGVKMIEKYSSGTVRKSLRFTDLSKIPIPIPPKEVQQEFINCFKNIEEHKKDIEIQVNRIQESIKRIWGED